MENRQISSLQLISVRWWNATAYYAVSLAQALQAENHPVFVGGTPESPPVLKAKELHLPIFDKISLESMQPGKLIASYKQLKNFLRRNDIQLVNAHRPEDHLFGGLLKRKMPELSLIRTVGDVRPPKNNPVNRWLHLEATDFFIFSSHANQQRYQNLWPIPDAKCAVIHACVDTDYFKSNRNRNKLRTQLQIKAGQTLFGLIGRFSPVKDHETFLKAAALLATEHHDARFLMSGEEVELKRDDLRRMMGRLGISDAVILLEKAEDVRELISAIDVGVVASRGSEAICRIASEFMAMGKPLVVTDVNVLPEMVKDAQEGFVVPQISPALMAQRMVELNNNLALRRRMGTKARNTAIARFSIPVFRKKTLQVYQNVLEQQRKSL